MDSIRSVTRLSFAGARRVTRLSFAGARRVVGEFTLSPAQIRDAHGRQLHSMQFFGREGDRDPDDAIEYAVVAEDAPEWATLSQQANVRACKGKSPLAESKQGSGRMNFNGTHLGKVTLFVGNQKVEDIVLARIDSGLERGPGDGGNWRKGAAQSLESSLIPKSGQMGQLVLSQHLSRQAVVKSVEP